MKINLVFDCKTTFDLSEKIIKLKFSLPYLDTLGI